MKKESEEERILSEFIRRIDDEGLDSVYDDLEIFLEKQKENEDERILNEIVDLMKRNKIRPIELNAIINSLPFIRKYFKEVTTEEEFKKKWKENYARNKI